MTRRVTFYTYVHNLGKFSKKGGFYAKFSEPGLEVCIWKQDMFMLSQDLLKYVVSDTFPGVLYNVYKQLGSSKPVRRKVIYSRPPLSTGL